MRPLAVSAGLKPAEIVDIVRAAFMPPMPSVPLGAWGVVRVRAGSFVFVQSQLNRAGGAVLHFAALPGEMLRALGGNLRVIMRLLQTEMPVYERGGARLLPVALPDAGPPGAKAQIDAMLALMSCTRERLDVIEQLLAAIVQGAPLVIRNAPPNPAQRAALVEGLLALLPPPARFGVTFAMHALPTSRLDAQVRFLAGQDVALGGAVIYDWAEGQVIGERQANDYSRFIISQFRLDPELVLEQTEHLTPVAGWRLKRGDSLAEALGYASYRLVLDNSLQNNLPVAAGDATRVLAEDPTLSTALRVDYARHVLAFAVGLADLEQAEPLAAIVRQEPVLEVAVLRQLEEAALAGKARFVFDLALRWLQAVNGPRGMEWIALAQAAAQARVQELVEAADPAGLRAFLLEAHHADGSAEIAYVMPALLSRALPLTPRDDALARAVFELAANYLPAPQLQRLIETPPFIALLPEPMTVFAEYLSGVRTGAKAGLLTDAAGAFGEVWSTLALIRLVELTLLAQRSDLLDRAALEAMARASLSPHAGLYEGVFEWLVRALSTDETLPGLEPMSAYALLQILLARGAYTELARELLRHGRVLYNDVERQQEYAALARRLFFETPIADDAAISALRYLDAGGVKPLPLVMAHFGALARARWPEALHEAAINLTTLLAANHAFNGVIPASALMDLLEYHARRRDLNQGARVGALLPALAAGAGDSGVTLIAQAYRALSWDKPAQRAALDLLRQYIRLADEERAQQAIPRLGTALGSGVEAALWATYALRQMMDGEDVAGYALLAHITTALLRDTAVVYVDKREAPGLKSLLGDLDSLVGGLTDDDRDVLARTMLALGRAIDALGSRQKETRPRDFEGHVQALAGGRMQPRQALDVLRLLAGRLAGGQQPPAVIAQAATTHPFGDRAAPSLLLEARVALRVLSSLLKAFPQRRLAALTPETLRAELDSLMETLSAAERRRLTPELAADFAALPELIWHIYDNGDSRALADAGGLARKLDSNRHKPESTLELYRFVHGYFLQRIRER